MYRLPVDNVASKVAKLLMKSESPTNVKRARGLISTSVKGVANGPVEIVSGDLSARINMPVPATHFGYTEGTDPDEFWDDEARIPDVWEILNRILDGPEDSFYSGWDYCPRREVLTLRLRY